MSAAWFTDAPAASAEVRCRGETHTIYWRDGALHTPAHADPEGERALGALGGEVCRCVELLSAWERHAADPAVLVLGPRGREPLGAARLRRDPGHRRHRVRMTQLGMWQEPQETPLEAVLSLEGLIPRRLVATVAAALLPRAAEPEIAAALYGALYGRLLASFRSWRSTLFSAKLDLSVSDGESAFTQDSDGRFQASLPLRWLTDVWARELDVINDELTLSARPRPGGGFELLTVDYALATHVRTTGPR